MMETSSRVQPRGHRSVPDVGACELGARRNVNSTPKKCKSPRDGSFYTDPVPSRTRRRNEQDSFTPGRHLPAHMSPIRPRRASWGIDCSVPGSSPGVRKLSFVGECPGSVRGNPGGSPQAYERMFMSTTSSDGPICRICHDGDQAGPLSSYCSCSGTGLTHVHGLESWVSSRNTEVWESCQNRFPSMQSRRPLADWISGQQRRALVFDLGCFVLLSPIAFFGLKLSVQGASKQATTRHFWQAGSLILLAFFLVGAFLAWAYSTAKCHYKSFKKWQNTNMKVTLAVQSKSIMVDSSSYVA